MGYIKLGLLILGLLSISSAWPRRARSGVQKGHFIGDATNELSAAIFQSYVDDETNLAFSPLGYSVILAVLAEGAKGETRDQLATALKLPNDQELIRNMYKNIMERLRLTNQFKLNTPEFKNWFYVYKNYTINDDYRKILEKYYLTEVKSVERYDSSFFQIKKEDEKKDSKVEKAPAIEINDSVKSEGSKEHKVEPEKLPKEVEKNNEKPDEEKIISFAIEDKPEKVEKVEVEKSPENVKPGKNIKENIKLANSSNKKSDSGSDLEIMEAVEARDHARRTKSLFGRDDVSTSLSANNVGSKSKDTASLMILFNGLYFRGSWKIPLMNIPPENFYRTQTKKVQVPMMEASGTFRTGSLPGLDSVAVELPYEGDRYALILVVPRARSGLRRLVADLPGLPPSELSAALLPKELKVKLPSFNVEVTTKPLAALAKFGVSSIFGTDADLSGISSVPGLFVQEMVQHVSVKVDDGGNSHAQLTASNPVVPLERSQPLKNDNKLEEFVLDRPFLFFVMDVVDNIVVVAGKITNPLQVNEL